MADPFDRRTRDAALLQETLRQVLATDFPHTPHDMLASALAYELASLIAADARDIQTALHTLAAVVEAQIQQIAMFGIGKPHP